LHATLFNLIACVSARKNMTPPEIEELLEGGCEDDKAILP